MSPSADPAARIAELEAQLAAERKLRAHVEAERDRLREAYEALKLEVELARRRLIIAKAERMDTTQLELEFATKLAALDALAGQVPDDGGEASDDDASPADPDPRKEKKKKRTGRRDLRLLDLPEERVEVMDPQFEGKAARIGTEESYQLRWRRGGFVRLVIVRIKYVTTVPGDAAVANASNPTAAGDGPTADVVQVETSTATSAPEGAATPTADEITAQRGASDAVPEVTDTRRAIAVVASTIVTAALPPTLLSRSMAAPSLVAHIASDKFCDGLPLHRQEDRFTRLGVPIDRGTMCRWLEEAGAVVGVTIVEAMRREALRTAFCIATDATGVLVQPTPRADKQRQPCRRAHFFVQIADADHVFFEYTPTETSAIVSEMFRGFSGYVQADAKSVYDVLYRPPKERDRVDSDPSDPAVRHEVGCWSHARTKHWEAAVATQHVVAREALARIMRMFQLERTWKERSPEERKVLRDRHLRPHVVAFFEFVEPEYERVKHQRGMLCSALGYCVRQREALMRFLDDGRLGMTNNHSYAARGITPVMPRAGLCRVGATHATNPVGSLMVGGSGVGIVRGSRGRRAGGPRGGIEPAFRRRDLHDREHAPSASCRRGGRFASSRSIRGRARVQ
jgi:transposase